MQDLHSPAQTVPRFSQPDHSFPPPLEVPKKPRIPVPPYDQPLPKDYWEGLKPPPSPPIVAKTDWPIAAVRLGLLGLVFVVGYLFHQPAPQTPAPVTQPSLPEPVVRPPVTYQTLTQESPKGVSWIPGHQYRIPMPDGRRILVNFKGWVDHACNLPKQPKGGANNALYIETATGNGWVWTIPASGSNVPRWIDPPLQ